MVSKISCKYIRPVLEKKFQPIQVGFGSRSGCEAAVHATRTFLGGDSSQVLLKVDVKNAFNSIDRGTLLSEVKEHIPAIFPYLWQCYSKPSKLMYKEHLVLSSMGCQQGDPLGPAIFSLGIHPIISSLDCNFNIWYLDDGTLGGQPDVVLGDLKVLIDRFNAIGLELNFAKCELYIHPSISPDKRHDIISKFCDVAPNIQIATDASLRLLGAPLLDDSVPLFIKEQVDKFQQTSDRLLGINSHMAITIIKFCLFVPQFTYVLRCCHLWKFQNLLSAVDDCVSDLLTKVLNCRLTVEAWTQASLPVRFGGIGIRKVSSVSLPAFIASAFGCTNLFNKIINPSMGHVEVDHLSAALDCWKSLCHCDIPTTLHSQKQWDEPLCKGIQQGLLSACSDTAERARLLAVFEKESGLWLNALPSANIGTLLDNCTLSLAISLRLGLKTNQPHQCKCGTSVDELGHHGLSCQKSAGRIPRHAALNDVLRRALASANIPAKLEPNGIVRSDGKRPDGLTLIPWQQGRCLVWDVTCVDTLAPSHVRATCVRAGAAAAGAEILKTRKYDEIAAGCYMFSPLGFETMGPWGPEAKKVIKDLSARLINTSGDRRAGSFLAQRISITIQRGNAASLLGTMSCGDALEDIFYL